MLKIYKAEDLEFKRRSDQEPETVRAKLAPQTDWSKMGTNIAIRGSPTISTTFDDTQRESSMAVSHSHQANQARFPGPQLKALSDYTDHHRLCRMKATLKPDDCLRHACS